MIPSLPDQTKETRAAYNRGYLKGYEEGLATGRREPLEYKDGYTEGYAEGAAFGAELESKRDYWRSAKRAQRTPRCSGCGRQIRSGIIEDCIEPHCPRSRG